MIVKKQKLSSKEQQEIDLKNLLLFLQMDIRGTKFKNQIGNQIRIITQKNQEFTVTRKLKELYNSVGVDVPDTITHYALKPITKKAMDLLPNEPILNNTIAQTEHILEIEDMTNYLLSKRDTLFEMDKESQLNFLKDYFQNECKMFHKLIYHEKHLQTRKPYGMEMSDLVNEVVNPYSINWKLL